MSSELASGGTVSSTTPKGHSPSALFADSLQVTYTGIIVSNLKMSPDESDTVNEGTIKTGPFLIEFDSTGTRIVTSASVTAGTYDRIKFEIHKLNAGVDDSLIANPKFSDYVANNATMKIMGHVWVGGVRSEFTYYSGNTENIQVLFDPPVTIAANSTTNVTLQFDPALVFISGASVLDPREAANDIAIKLALKAAFHIIKKS